MKSTLRYLDIKITPCCNCTSTQTFEKQVDLLLILDAKSQHYILIKDFNRFITNKTKHYGIMFFVNITYNASAA